VSAGRRRWARIATGSSAVLLLLAVISLLQLSDELIESFDPEANNIVKLGPGESGYFGIEESTVVSALRVSDGGTPDSELTLVDASGAEVSGSGPGWMAPNRIGSDDETVYSPVREFKDLKGNYTLQNDGDSDLWLVDDGVSADKMFGNIWLYLFYIGCCIGTPVGLVGIILAIMVWTDKRKLPDQFVIIDNGSVIMEGAQNEVSALEGVGEAPNPFWVAESRTAEKPQEDKADETWKKWDEG